MDKILAMKQKRAELIKKMRAMVEAATSATRDFNDDEKAKAFSQNGKDYIRPYLDINKSTEQLVEIYKEIIKK